MSPEDDVFSVGSESLGAGDYELLHTRRLERENDELKLQLQKVVEQDRILRAEITRLESENRMLCSEVEFLKMAAIGESPKSTQKDFVPYSSVLYSQAIPHGEQPAEELWREDVVVPVVSLSGEHQIPLTIQEPAMESDKEQAHHAIHCPDAKHVQSDDVTAIRAEFWDEVRGELALRIDDAKAGRLAAKLQSDIGAGNLLMTDRFDQANAAGFVVVPEGMHPGELWILGDLHGDLLGLETAVRYAKALSASEGGGSPSFLFLGDLFDRGKRQCDVVFKVLEMICTEPGRHALILGNHDEGLAYDDGSALFRSSVNPSEFADWLNSPDAGDGWRELAKASIRFFKNCPRAVLMPDGVLFSHGGVPHTDRQAGLSEFADFQRPEVLEDFVWTRMHESPRKIPNRTTRGCSLGVEDFNSFCRKAASVLGRPVLGLTRGHDHLEGRHAFLARYTYFPVLTINTLPCRMDCEMGPPARPVVIARYREGSMPEAHVLGVPEDLYPGHDPSSASPVG